MKSFLQEAAADVLIFLATFFMATATCAKHTVTCGAEPEQAQVRAP